MADAGKNGLKKLFVIPPGISYYESPLLGVPTIVAYLRSKGVGDVAQKDLNLEMFEYYATKDGIGRALAQIAERTRRVKKTPLKRVYSAVFVSLLNLYFASVRDGIGKSIKDLREMEFGRSLTIEDYDYLIKRVLDIPKLMSYGYSVHPFQMAKFSNKLYRKDLLEALGRRIFEDQPVFSLEKGLDTGLLDSMDTNPYYHFYNERVVPELEREAVGFLGISVSFFQQMPSALALAYAVRKRLPHVHICMGGTHITNIYAYNQLDSSHFEFVDSMVPYEGEATSYELVTALERKEPHVHINNLITFSGGKITRTGGVPEERLDRLPPPDFDGLPLDKYLCRPMRLPFITSRGCYWGKCTFCDHFKTLGNTPFRMRSAELVCEDIISVVKKTGASAFFFTDEALPLKTIKCIVEGFGRPGTPSIKWIAQQRFEKGLTGELLEKMKRSGCTALFFGLESINQRIQKLIRKGIDLKEVRRILEDCKRLGINTHLFAMIGVPTETREEAGETIDFLIENRGLYTTFEVVRFCLMAGSPMAQEPEKYGIRIKSSNGFTIDFEADNTLTEKEMRELMIKVNDGEMFYKNIVAGSVYKLNRLFAVSGHDRKNPG